MQANGALRTLCLAHIDYPSTDELEEGWEVDSPDADNMILDAIVGIMDPLRDDVKEAVATAQRAGVMVRIYIIRVFCVQNSKMWV